VGVTLDQRAGTKAGGRWNSPRPAFVRAPQRLRRRKMSPAADRRWLTLAIVNVAIPSIQLDLHIQEKTVQWVITAYAITFGGFLLLGGRMADLLGRRLIFLVGLIIFTSASFVCGLANSSSVLISARAVQGLGAAIISPAALSIVTTTFSEGAERNKALG